MEDGGAAQTGMLDSQVSQQAGAGLGAGGNGDANGGKSGSEVGARESAARVAGAVAKKRRGRPRKYGPDGGLLWSPPSASSRLLEAEVLRKRGRGRPRGSPSRALHSAPIGGIQAGGFGQCSGAQTVTIHRGEEILAKLSSMIGPDSHSLSILSATGALSSAIVREPGPAGGSLSYEGFFEILSLSGSFAIQEGRICMQPELCFVNVMLIKPDGEVVGGGVAGPLVAAGPTQLAIAIFKHNGHNELMGVESIRSYATSAVGVPANPLHHVRQPEQIARMAEVNDNSGAPTSVLLEPTDGEAKTTITFENNDIFPASLHIDEHNPLELLETMFDQNVSTDTKTNVLEL